MITLKNYRGKNVVVFGLGITGISVINALKRSGANIYAWDDKNIPDIAGVNFAHYSTYDWSLLDELILSPGVPLTPHEIVFMAKKHGCLVSSDIDMLFVSEPRAKFIGITGTNGKSTTTSLIHHILSSNEVKSCIGGNIGIPVLDLESNADIYVLEMSSYQLNLSSKIKFDISVLLNITPDHLDRHGNMTNYIAAKKKILGKIAVIGRDDNTCEEIYKEFSGEKIGFSTKKILSKGISYYNEQIFCNGVTSAPLVSPVISENIAAAYSVCWKLGVKDQEIMDSIKTFKNLPHRMEFFRKVGNVIFINDSKATNAAATQQALAKYKNIYWIAGGKAKEGGIDGLDLTNVKKTFLIGEAGEEFAKTLKELKKPYVISGELERAVKSAHQEALTSGGNITVLLSPACSSFDQWKDFAERGEAFKDLLLPFE